MRIVTVSRKRKPDTLEFYQVSYTIYLRKIVDAGSHWVLHIDVSEAIKANRLIFGWRCKCKVLHNLKQKSCENCALSAESGRKILIKEKIKMLNIFQMRCNYAKNNNEKKK